MIIERNLTEFVVLTDDTLITALQKIGRNKTKSVLIVNESGQLEAIMTDGDLRRWLVAGHDFNDYVHVLDVGNTEFTSLPIDANAELIASTLNDRITLIPLLNPQGRLEAVALNRLDTLRIGNFNISADSSAFVIAEIGNNHNGSLELAKQLVDLAIESGADCAKFQMRDMKSLYSNQGDADDASEDLGSQYVLDLLKRFQLKKEEFIEIFDYCKSKGILPLCTPWDIASVEFLDGYGIAGFKVASADLTNHELLTALAKTGRPLLCSTGMAVESEVIAATQLLKRLGAKFALLHCNSTYPAPFKDINLRYLNRLQEISSGPVGYSGHERGINVAIAAVALGSKIIEKHFTVDKGMEGNDHKVSLLPHEFKAMVEGIRDVESALGHGGSRTLTQGEMMNREVLGKSLVMNCDLPEGALIEKHMLDIRSPGKGLPPYRNAELVGKMAVRTLRNGDFLYPSDLGLVTAGPRPFKFSRPFGVPVRYHDFSAMRDKSNFDLIEFHLSYKDLELDISKFLAGPYQLELIVHAPELFVGDHILDLSAPEDSYRQQSLQEMQRVIDKTRLLKTYFPATNRPVIITNVGGFSTTGFMTANEKAKRVSILKESLESLDTIGIEIIPQTMPPFPWHFGGQSYHNLFVHADEIVDFCKEMNYRVCFDISHSKLACTYYKQSFEDFVRKIGPYSAHLHIVDSKGVDGEGLQIGEGEIDFKNLALMLKEYAPTATFIPEIWQGHKNDGAGFWQALDMLEKYGF